MTAVKDLVLTRASDLAEVGDSEDQALGHPFAAKEVAKPTPLAVMSVRAWQGW
ncbi:hypothetical protein QF027_008303 [Streptomyces canus]|nr:hypothetical protein [Streptomyces canus]